MIQANELRRGIFIMDRGNKMWAIDCWESCDKVAAKIPSLGIHPVLGEMFGHPFTEKLEYLQPIPLTPEILEKCGFENDNVFEKMFKYLNKSIYDTDKLTFRKEEGFICFDGIKYRTLLKHIIYLHQLQNLYFALTGEELTVNL